LAGWVFAVAIKVIAIPSKAIPAATNGRLLNPKELSITLPPMEAAKALARLNAAILNEAAITGASPAAFIAFTCNGVMVANMAAPNRKTSTVMM